MCILRLEKMHYSERKKKTVTPSLRHGTVEGHSCEVLCKLTTHDDALQCSPFRNRSFYSKIPFPLLHLIIDGKQFISTSNHLWCGGGQ